MTVMMMLMMDTQDIVYHALMKTKVIASVRPVHLLSVKQCTAKQTSTLRQC